MTVDDGSGEGDEFAIADARLLAQHLKRGTFVDAVAFREDALRALDHRASSERALKVVGIRQIDAT